MTGFDSLAVSDPAYEPDGVRFAAVGSRALGRRADLCAYAPPRTPEGAPLVVLLHGVLGSHWQWSFLGGAHRTLERLVSARRVQPMVLAMPSDGLWGRGSGYLRLPAEDAETWVRDEVPAAAAELYPGAGARGTCIAGLSMGGFGALRLAGKHPDRYVAAAGTSSVTTLERLRDFSGHDYPVTAGEDALATVLRDARARLPLRLDCGAEDELLEDNRALHRTLDDAAVPHEYHEFPGGHEWSYWGARLSEILEFFDRCLRDR